MQNFSYNHSSGTAVKQYPDIDITPYLYDEHVTEIREVAAASTLTEEEAWEASQTFVPVQGQGKLGIMVVLSHPIAKEVAAKRLSASYAYQRMANDLAVVGVDIERDCYTVAAVPHKVAGMIPSKKLYDANREYLHSVVTHYKPKVVFIVGRNALYGWHGHRASRGVTFPIRVPDNLSYYHDFDYDMWTGQVIPDKDYAFIDERTNELVCPAVIPVFNPHDVGKMEKANMNRAVVDSILPRRNIAILGMGKAIAARGEYQKYSTVGADHQVRVLTRVEDAVAILASLTEQKATIAYDYETTGIKPYNKGQRIICMGIVNLDNPERTAYAMPFFSDSPQFMHWFKQLMVSPEVKKIAHNLKFEYNWTRVALGGEAPQGVHWDTMLAAHILDMRDGLTGLKTQTYLRFGDSGYDHVIHNLLRTPIETILPGYTPPKVNGKVKPRKKSTNDLNLLHALDANSRHSLEFGPNVKVWQHLLKYVAADAAFTAALYDVQQRELELSGYHDHLQQGIQLFMDSTVALAEMEYQGFDYDKAQSEINKAEIVKEMQELKSRMLATEEHQRWKAVHPDKDLNTNSNPQMQEFLYTILKYDIPKYTNSGKPSTDRQSLEQINSEFTNLLLDYKALEKMLGSFITGYDREVNDDNRIRTIYNLHNVKSYRTSASDINLQNVSKRSSAAKYALTLFKPHKGQVLLAADFKSLEVFVSSAHTGDRNLTTYLQDPSTDMHRDIACQVYFYTADELESRVRSNAKKIVFGWFYGAGYKSAAIGQWMIMTAKDRAQLAKNGITNYPEFEAHMKKIFDHFWGVRFRDYTVWKEQQWQFYVENGYFLGKTGFWYTGICNPRQVSNFPIQGDASHLLLYLVIHMRKWLLSKPEMKSKLIGEIHDSLIFSAEDNEVPAILQEMSNWLATLPSSFPWTSGLNFAIEAERSEVDGNMYEMHEFAFITPHGVEWHGDDKVDDGDDGVDSYADLGYTDDEDDDEDDGDVDND